MRWLVVLLITTTIPSAKLHADFAHAGRGESEGSNIVFVPLPPHVSKEDIQQARAAVSDELRHVQTWLASRGNTAASESGADLVIILTDQDGQPILPDMEAARRRADTTATHLAQAPPVNELTFSFNSPAYPWSAAEVTDLMAQLGDYYPAAKAVYGSPAFNIVVNIRKDPTIPLPLVGLYFPSTNEMVVKNNTDHDVICHEMIHAFRDDYLVSPMSYEEGMTRAAEIEVFARLPAYTHAFDENHSYTYDVYYEALNRPEIGSRSGSFFNTSPNTFFLLRYQLAGYAWGKALLENPQFFVTFNQQLYSAIVSDPSTQYTESKLTDIAAIVQPAIEGIPFRSWYGRQAMLNTSPPAGYFLYQRINQYVADYFYRDASGAETMQANATINWAAYDYQDTLLDSGSGITTSYGWIDCFPTLPATYAGRIKILTTAMSPNGLVSNIAFRPASGETGVFGVVLGADSGTVTIASLDSPAPPVNINVINGSFSAPALAAARGRFLAVFAGTNGRYFSKQFNKDASNYYVLLVEPIRVTSLAASGLDATIRFTTVAGYDYRVERTDSLSGTISWTALTGAESLAGSGGILEVTDAGASAQPQRFYRVRRFP